MKHNNTKYRLVELVNLDEVDPLLSLHPVARLLAETSLRSAFPLALPFPPLFSKGIKKCISKYNNYLHLNMIVNHSLKI